MCRAMPRSTICISRVLVLKRKGGYLTYIMADNTRPRLPSTHAHWAVYLPHSQYRAYATREVSTKYRVDRGGDHGRTELGWLTAILSYMSLSISQKEMVFDPTRACTTVNPMNHCTIDSEWAMAEGECSIPHGALVKMQSRVSEGFHARMRLKESIHGIGSQAVSALMASKSCISRFVVAFLKPKSSRSFEKL